MMRFYTYLWCDPKDKTPRYVGKGCKQRVWDQIQAIQPNTQTTRMLKKRFDEGFICIPKIIWVDSEAEAFELEKLLISEIGRQDLGQGPLFNHTDGGAGGRIYLTPEAEQSRRERIRASKKGAKRSALTCARMSAARLGKSQPKISAALKGKPGNSWSKERHTHNAEYVSSPWGKANLRKAAFASHAARRQRENHHGL